MSGLYAELPGDWSSARLLVRVLTTLGSDWDLTERGLVERDSGALCRVRMGPADPTLPDRFAAHGDPAFPSLTDADQEGLREHRAVLRVEPAAGSLDGARALLRCGSALVDAGARAVAAWPAGLAHSAERWQQLARLAVVDDDDDDDDDGPDRASVAVARALVRLIARDGDAWTTRGLAALGFREVRVAGDVDETYAYEVNQALVMHLLAGQPLVGGERLQAGRAGPMLAVSARGDGWWVSRA